MLYDLSAEAIIRAGSGILFVVLGLWCLRRASRGQTVLGGSSWAFGAATIGYGLHYVLFNLLAFPNVAAGPGTGELPAWLVAAQLGADVLWAVAASAWVGSFLRANLEARRARVLAVTGACAAGAWLAFNWSALALGPDAYFPGASAWPGFLLLAYGSVLQEAGILVLPLVVALAWPRLPSPQRRPAAAIALAFGLHAAFGAGTDVVLPFPASGTYMIGIAAAPVAAAMGFAWLAAAGSPVTKAGRAIAWTILAVMLGGMLLATVEQSSSAYGVIGVVRTIGVVLAAWGVQQSRHTTILALAALFVVSQIAQNFLSAQVGLVAGAMVAGLAVFWLSFGQRTMEGWLHKHESREHETTYRRMADSMLRKGPLSRDDERDLAELATVLGIDASRAFALLEAAEAKARAAAAARAGGTTRRPGRAPRGERRGRP